MKMQCKRLGGMTHSLIMEVGSMEDDSGGEFIIINWQNSNYLAPTTGPGGGTVAGNSVREIENLIRVLGEASRCFTRNWKFVQGKLWMRVLQLSR